MLAYRHIFVYSSTLSYMHLRNWAVREITWYCFVFGIKSCYRLLVDLSEELVVAEERVFVLADLDGAAAELWMY